MGVQLGKQSIDIGIVTTRGAEMLAFYRETLGLRYLREMPMPGGAVMHQMLCGESMVKLIVARPGTSPAVPGGIAGGTGYRYWTMTVANLTEMVAACVAQGCALPVKEYELRPGVRIAIVEDPDGNWVEFLMLG